MSAFETASEFFDATETDEDAVAARETPRAKAILLYDQMTPLFLCCEHRDALDDLSHSGDEFGLGCEMAGRIRSMAYSYLFEEDPVCDACEGRLREVIEGGD